MASCLVIFEHALLWGNNTEGLCRRHGQLTYNPQDFYDSCKENARPDASSLKPLT